MEIASGIWSIAPGSRIPLGFKSKYQIRLQQSRLYDKRNSFILLFSWMKTTSVQRVKELEL